MSGELRSTAVIRGLHDLYDAAGAGPTAEAIAEYLEAEVADVLKHLRYLKDLRLVQDRRGRGERRWEPWS